MPKKNSSNVNREDQPFFDYIYNQESERFSFYRIPKALFTNPIFKPLSSNAKILYGLMLDRVGLSLKNGWVDDNGRVYIYYTVEKIEKDLGCSKPTAVKSIDELSTDKGIGLIEKKRQGQGKPTVIYVKDFSSSFKDLPIDKDDDIEDSDFEDNIDEANDYNLGEKNPETSHNSSEVKNLYFKNESDETSRSKKSLLQEVKNINSLKSNKSTSKSKNNQLQEVKNLNSNNTEYNKNGINNTKNNNPIYLSREDEIDGLSEYEKCLIILKEDIDYDLLVDYINNKTIKSSVKELDGIVNIVADILAFKRDEVKISGVTYPYSYIKSRFSNLKYYHIEYVLNCLNDSDVDIRNIKAYILASLNNALDNMELYYSNQAKQIYKTE